MSYTTQGETLSLCDVMPQTKFRLFWANQASECIWVCECEHPGDFNIYTASTASPLWPSLMWVIRGNILLTPAPNTTATTTFNYIYISSNIFFFQIKNKKTVVEFFILQNIANNHILPNIWGWWLIINALVCVCIYEEHNCRTRIIMALMTPWKLSRYLMNLPPPPYPQRAPAMTNYIT